MSVSGEYGILKKGFLFMLILNDVTYDQTVLGTDYLDCSRESLARTSSEVADASSNVVSFDGNSFRVLGSAVKVHDE